MTRPTKSTKPTTPPIPPSTEESATASAPMTAGVAEALVTDEVLPHLHNAIGNATQSPPRASTE